MPSVKSTLRTLAAIALAGAALSLAGPAHADDIHDLSVTDESSAAPRFHDVGTASFLPGVVDESWIVAFGGK